MTGLGSVVRRVGKFKLITPSDPLNALPTFVVGPLRDWWWDISTGVFCRVVPETIVDSDWPIFVSDTHSMSLTHKEYLMLPRVSRI